jgi:hypothetical protein
MISLRPASLRDLVWNFARAEFEIPEFGLRHAQPRITPDLRSRVLLDQRDTFSEADWAALRQALLSTRSDLVQPLIDRGADWFLGELPSNEWPRLRVLNLRIFTDIVPSRSLGELSAAMDDGAAPVGWDPSRYLRLRRDFDLAKMHGYPIVVSERLTGPYILIEGVTRMLVLVSRTRSGMSDVSRVPLLLGVTSYLSAWEFY